MGKWKFVIHFENASRTLPWKTSTHVWTVSVVLQEPYLFSGTIAYNLKFGQPNVSDEEMIQISRILGIHDSVMKLENGYDTVIQEQGTTLSYGEHQLICLGRALPAYPRILVFNEATSSVDPYTEALFQNAMKAEMTNRTVLLVPHRVSTVRDADRIPFSTKGG